MDAAIPSGAQVTISHSGQRATIVEVGGGLREYLAADGPVLEGYAPDQPCDGARGQILAPWPNRLDAGRYSWRGRHLQVPVTEPGRGTAIHGLVRRARWDVIATAEEEARARHMLEPTSGYPFRLSLEVSYRLGADGLAVSTTVTNLGGEPAPFGLGFHPYLTAGTETIDRALLELDAEAVVDLDGRGLPTGRLLDVRGTELDLGGGPIGTRVLDHCYTRLARTEGVARATLRAPDGSRARTLWMDESFRYVMVFTGDTLGPAKRRRGLAVEPMTGPPNALATGTAVIELLPAEPRSFRWGVGPP